MQEIWDDSNKCISTDIQLKTIEKCGEIEGERGNRREKEGERRDRRGGERSCKRQSKRCLRRE